jgi:hypothetical protein
MVLPIFIAPGKLNLPGPTLMACTESLICQLMPLPFVPAAITLGEVCVPTAFPFMSMRMSTATCASAAYGTAKVRNITTGAQHLSASATTHLPRGIENKLNLAFTGNPTILRSPLNRKSCACAYRRI